MEQRQLTQKQAVFAREYLIDLNATQAAIRAGYSRKTAGWIGQQLLSKTHISLVIQELMAERSQRTAIDQDYVLKTIQETVERCKKADTFDSRAVLKGCELLGRHLGLFNDKLNVNVTVQDVMAAFPEPIQKQIRETLAKRLG